MLQNRFFISTNTFWTQTLNESFQKVTVSILVHETNPDLLAITIVT